MGGGTEAPQQPSNKLRREHSYKGAKEGEKAYLKWTDFSCTPRSDGETFMFETLRKLYPTSSIFVISGWTSAGFFTVLNFPEALVVPLPDVPAIIHHSYRPLNRLAGQPGVLSREVDYAAFKVAWKEFDFTVYSITYSMGFNMYQFEFIVHDGPQEHSEQLAIAAGGYLNGLHEEIWVFNNGYWQKDHDLWVEVQRADWDDIILKDQFKDQFRKDVEDFFSSEPLYKKYALPWKRGVIMHGPPGNGKTVSLKAIMKTVPYPSLYVRSFQTYGGEELGMTMIFNKARELAPCMLVLEDLDSLINSQNRSFFLNQIDGLKGNDGLLVLATTNYLDRLDPSLSKRPSRFDRKFLFDDPDEEERQLYCQYWQKKLESNEDIIFPDVLVTKIASTTGKFSFAYLKEAFVSSLVLFAKAPKAKAFETVILEQIEILKGGLSSSVTPTAAPTRGHLDAGVQRQLELLRNGPSAAVRDQHLASMHGSLNSFPGPGRFMGAPSTSGSGPVRPEEMQTQMLMLHNRLMSFGQGDPSAGNRERGHQGGGALY